MNTHTSDSHVFSAVVAEHARAGAGEHPDTEILTAYLTTGLADEIEAEVNDHLVSCRRCTEQLLDLAPLAQPEIPREGVADLATEAAWREIRARLFAVEATPRPAAWPAVRQRWHIAVAASLLLTTAGMSAWVARLQQSKDGLQRHIAELSSPQANMPIYYIGETTRSLEEEMIEVPAEATHFLLIFTPVELVSYPEYEVRFFDSEGREVLLVGGLELSETGGLRSGLSREQLPAGEYRITVSGFDGGRWQLLEENRRRIVYQEGP